MFNFKRIVISSLTSLALICSANSFSAENPRVALKTDLGTIVLELYPKEAPKTVENFLAYVDSGFYDGTIFHRVIPGFVVQGGGMTFDFTQKETRDSIENESRNGLKNSYKTIAMARTANPHSATAQFYINVKDNFSLDATERQLGYTVFGQVVEGMEVVEKITQEPRGMHRAHPDAPDYAVRTLNATRVDENFKANNSTTKAQPPMSNQSVRDAIVQPQ